MPSNYIEAMQAYTETNSKEFRNKDELGRKRRLKELEEIIEAGFNNQIKLALALKEMKEGEYFKDLGFKNFYKYCSDRWNREPTTIKQLLRHIELVSIGAGTPINDIETYEESDIGKQNLSVYTLRPIAESGLDEESKKEVLDKLTETKKSGGKVSNTIAKEVVNEYKQAKVEALVEAAGVEIQVDERPQVELGDKWALGDHMLYCQDSIHWRESLALKEFPTMAFADPPYGANVGEWDKKFLWAHDWLQSEVDYVLVTPGIANHATLFKMTEMDYRWTLTAWVAGGHGARSALGFSNMFHILLFSRLQSVCDYEGDFKQLSYNLAEKDESNHRGRKPKELLHWLIERYSTHGDTVLDPFLGSGTTLLVAEAMGRKCHGCEIDPQHCGEIIQRWESMTGGAATRL